MRKTIVREAVWAGTLFAVTFCLVAIVGTISKLYMN